MQSPEARRIERGMEWGAISTVVGALVVLGAMALRLWPPHQPLSVMVVQMVGREYIGRQGSVLGAWLLGAALHVTWGALCGGLLALVTDRVTMTTALGMGALRWLFTMVIISPTLGWGDFGLLHLPSVALAAAFPHLAYALSLGWCMRQEDAGHAPIPLHLNWHPLAARHDRRRR